MKYSKQLFLFACMLLSTPSYAQYTLNVGNDITLYAPSSRDSKKPDLYDVKWNYVGTGDVTLISSTSNPVIVRGVSAGSGKVTCSARYYNRAKWTDPMYSGYIYENASYDITIVDPNVTGGSSGGGTGGDTGGGGSGGGSNGGALEDNTFFSAKTAEGHDMWFYVYTNTYEGFKYKICIVSPGLYTTSCVSQSTVGKVTIPEKANSLSVYSIDRHSFYNIAGITEIVIPNTVQSISSDAFWNCSNLKQLTVMSEVPPNAKSDSFDWSMYYNTTLYVPKGSKRRYLESNGWKEFERIKEIGVEYAEIPIEATNFPDENFRNYLLEQKYGNDGVISEDELEEVATMDINSRKIENLKGIEYFTALTVLYCPYNQLTSLDVSRNTALTSLDCSMNNLTSLDVSNNIALTSLNCSHNQITSLDVSKNIAIKSLNCFNNQLTSFDVSRNTALTSLDCSFNLLKDKKMDAFIQSLPYNYSGTKHSLYVVRFPDRDGNVCSTRQVVDIKAKGWTPYRAYSDNSTPIGIRWEEYEGSAPTTIEGIPEADTTSVPIYNLNGQRLSEPRKGINIIGGKKVIVK